MPIKTLDTIKRIILIVTSIGTVIILFMLLRWAGIKGILSFIAGMVIMAYLLLSNNIMTRVLVKMFEAEKGINEIMGKNERR